MFRTLLGKRIGYSVGALVAVSVIAVAALGQENKTLLYMAHLSPDAPAVDLYVNGTLIEQNVSYGFAGEQKRGPAGFLDVDVRLAGTSPDSEPVLSAEISTVPGGAYVVGVMNELDKLQIAAFPMEIQNLPSDAARVEVIHAIPEGPRINVLANGNIDVVREHGWVEDMRYADLPGGNEYLISVEVLNDGVISPLASESYALEGGTVYTLIVPAPPLQPIMIAARPE